MVEPYEVEFVIQEYHIYKEMWSAAVDSTLPYQQERFDSHDTYTVAMLIDNITVEIFNQCLFYTLLANISSSLTAINHDS